MAVGKCALPTRYSLEMNYIIVVTVILVLCEVCGVISLPLQDEVQQKRICVVGAGVAGLSVTRHLLEAGLKPTVLEATPYLGGTWRYDPRVGVDEYGRPIHTSMYKDLRTNVPYQLMELPGFPMPEDTPTFPNGTMYYKYLHDYAHYFQLDKYIKFLHEVTLIYRLGDAWRVVYRNLDTGQLFQEEFDYVLLCVGHYSKPRLPNLPGENIFKGSIIHSHSYREPEPYINRRVLIIGSGPSALDLITKLTSHSPRVVHSHHSSVKTPFPENYVSKPDVVQYTENGVLFKDGTFEKIDDVIYATGYELNFPFLHESCGLTVRPNSLTPLYRTIVNIQQPTMMVVGLTLRACAIVTIASQARYCASIVSGQGTLPSQQHMYQEWRRQAEELEMHGKKLSEIHAIPVGFDNLQYSNNLTSEAKIAPVPPVLIAMCAKDAQAKSDNFYTFRDYVYTILDEEHFTRVHVHKPRGAEKPVQCESGAPPRTAENQTNNEQDPFVIRV